MNRGESKRRFNEAIVNTLYPSPPQDLEPVEALIQEGSISNVISSTLEFEDSDNDSTSGDEEHNSQTEKLTRAQRKRIRKKKLKEEAIRRGKLIGPLQPSTPSTVRSNASEEGDKLACANSKKIKHRRRGKKMAKEKLVGSTLDKCNQSSISSVAVEGNETHV